MFCKREIKTSLFSSGFVLAFARIWRLVVQIKVMGKDDFFLLLREVSRRRSSGVPRVLLFHQPSEGRQIISFNRLDLYRKSPGSGELQCKSRSWTKRCDAALRGGGWMADARAVPGSADYQDIFLKRIGSLMCLAQLFYSFILI